MYFTDTPTLNSIEAIMKKLPYGIQKGGGRFRGRRGGPGDSLRLGPLSGAGGRSPAERDRGSCRQPRLAGQHPACGDAQMRVLIHMHIPADQRRAIRKGFRGAPCAQHT